MTMEMATNSLIDFFNDDKQICIEIKAFGAGMEFFFRGAVRLTLLAE